MATLQNIIDSVRVDLQDADGIRYTDAQLLEYCNDGIQEAFRLRPDFRLGSFTAAPVTYVAGSTVPFPVQYQMLLKHYVDFRAEIRDDEYSVDGRAAGLLARFTQELTK